MTPASILTVLVICLIAYVYLLAWACCVVAARTDRAFLAALRAKGHDV